MIKRFFVIALVAMVAVHCNRKPEAIRTHLNVAVSVSDSLDNSGNYSGFEFLLFQKDDPAAEADTLLFEVTDSTGTFEAIVEPEKAGAYPMQISRNGRILASVTMLLADEDTITFKTEFPDIQKNLVMNSREIRALKVYDRVDQNFKRTMVYAANGEIADSLLPGEFLKWSDLYWQVYEDKSGTFASKFALESSMELLNRVDRKQMFTKLNTAFGEEMAFGLAITLGKDYVADAKGLEATVAYLDSVRSITENEDIEKAIDQSIIKLYYDSARVDKARELLAEFDEEYNEDSEPTFWYKNMRFDLKNLAPGMKLPDYEFISTEGDTINNANMLGSPYVLEFTIMANKLYQQQYDKATVIYQMYANEGLKYFTIPFDQSVNTIIGFFEERDRYWSIAEPPSLNKKQLADEFNIQFYPTRILIDAEGKIVRKYVGEEFDDIIPDITQTLTKTN